MAGPNWDESLHPRVPAGQSGGGQFTSGGGSDQPNWENRSWAGFPFREATGDKPNSEDTPPERTKDGDFIFYHGTSQANAESIIRDKIIHPDDLHVVGVSTTISEAKVFGIMSGVKAKETPRTGVVLRAVVDKTYLAREVLATREIGGSGRNQFLIQPLEYDGWHGLPLKRVSKVK